MSSDQPDAQAIQKRIDEVTDQMQARTISIEEWKKLEAERRVLKQHLAALKGKP